MIKGKSHCWLVIDRQKFSGREASRVLSEDLQRTGVFVTLIFVNGNHKAIEVIDVDKLTEAKRQEIISIAEGKLEALEAVAA